jgi:hypothetical protein
MVIDGAPTLVTVEYGDTSGGIWVTPNPKPPHMCEEISGSDMEALMESEALPGETLYEHIKRVVYAYLQDKYPHLAGTVE